MFRVTREIDFCYGHRLLNYDGKCQYLHGHNGRAVIAIESTKLDERGMVLDFSDIKRVVSHWIDENLDHRMILHRDDPARAAAGKTGRADVSGRHESHGREHRETDLRLRPRPGLSDRRNACCGKRRAASPPTASDRKKGVEKTVREVHGGPSPDCLIPPGNTSCPCRACIAIAAAVLFPGGQMRRSHQKYRPARAAHFWQNLTIARESSAERSGPGG